MTLAAGEKVRLADGRELDKKQLFAEALRLETDEPSLVWVGLDLAE
jgi:hypothetical protein